MSKVMMIGITVAATAIVTTIITVVVVVGAFWLWFSGVCTEEMTLVQSSRTYRAIVSGKPEITARVYYLGFDKGYLLVLTAKSARHAEGYCVDLANGRAGLPNFPAYVPLFKYALVDRRIYDGVPEPGVLNVEWEVDDEKHESRMRIVGFQQTEAGDEEATKEVMPLAYQNEIVFIGGDN
jgi:hypothetical protein